MPRPQKHLKEIVDTTESPLQYGPIATMIAEVLKEENDAKPPRRELHISDVARCPRQIGYRLIGEPESNPTTTDSLVNFAVGTGVEDRLIDILEKHKKVEKVYRQLDFRVYHNNHTIEGHADLLLKMEGNDSLVEIKTINSRAMAFMLKQGDNGKADHRLQLAGYLYASHFPDAPIKPHNKGTILYIVKDATKGEPPLYEAHVDLADEIERLKREFDMMAIVERDAEQKALPERPDTYTFSKYPCNYCSYQSLCWKPTT